MYFGELILVKNARLNLNGNLKWKLHRQIALCKISLMTSYCMNKVETVQTGYTQIRSENTFVVWKLFRQVTLQKDFSWPNQSSLDLEVI